MTIPRQHIQFLQTVTLLLCLNIMVLPVIQIFILDFNAESVEGLFNGEVIPSPVPHQPNVYPFWGLLFIFSELPFILGTIFSVVRDALFISDERVLWRYTLGVLLAGMLIAGIMALVVNLYAEIYAVDAAERRVFRIIHLLAYYVIIWLAGTHHTLLGLNLLRWRNVTPWLGWATLVSGFGAVCLNFFQLNSDLAGFRVIVPIMVLSFDPFFWAFYLWVNLPPQPIFDDAPTITPTTRL